MNESGNTLSKEQIEIFLRYARYGDEARVKEIIDSVAKSDASSTDKRLAGLLHATDELSGNTALHLSCANGHLSIVRILILSGAPVDAKNLSGSTPLHYAALTGQIGVARELVGANAQLVVENNFEKTALDEALQGRHKETADYLMAQAEAQSRTKGTQTCEAK